MSDGCSDSFSRFVLISSCFPYPLALFDLLQPAPRRHRAFRFNAVGEHASVAVMRAKSFWSSAISINLLEYCFILIRNLRLVAVGGRQG
jgi:hypothetical protein